MNDDRSIIHWKLRIMAFILPSILISYSGISSVSPILQSRDEELKRKTNIPLEKFCLLGYNTCIPVKVSRRFGGTHRLYLQGWRVNQIRNKQPSWSRQQLEQVSSESESRYDGRSVGQSVLVSNPIWGSWPDINYSLTVTVFSVSGAPSDERSGLSFVLVTWTASVHFSNFDVGLRQLLILTRRRGHRNPEDSLEHVSCGQTRDYIEAGGNWKPIRQFPLAVSKKLCEPIGNKRRVTVFHPEKCLLCRQRMFSCGGNQCCEILKS
jgi:hypothetical protein